MWDAFQNISDNAARSYLHAIVYLGRVHEEEFIQDYIKVHREKIINEEVFVRVKKNVSILEIKKSKKNNLATEIIRLDLDVVFKDRDSMLGRRGGSRIIISRFLLRVSKLMCIIFDAKIGSKKRAG